MRIQVRLKLRPFTHTPGVFFPIPYTTWEVQIFPALLKFRNLVGFEEKDISLSVQGPVRGFTAMLNLEKGRIEVFGRGKNGYFKQYIDKEEYPFLKKQDLVPSQERLSLGIHKKQDWDFIQRRLDIAEIFPFWLRLSQLIPKVPLPKKPIGVMHLFYDLSLLFQAGFQGILSPRLMDENYLGLIKQESISREASPIGILHEGARQIRALFFYEEKDHIHVLPALPKELHAGRYVGLQTVLEDQIDIEWSKKQIKKIIIQPKETRIVHLHMQRKIQCYRLRKSLRHRGELRKRDIPLELKANQRLYLDRFQC